MKTHELEDRIVRYGDSLEYFAISLTANKDDAKDLVQDTLLKALVNQERYEEETNLKAWLFTIMKNTFINNYRRKQKTNILIDSSSDLCHLNNFSNTDMEKADHSTNLNDINEAIASISEDQSIPFKMINEGYKYQEIAEKYNLSIGTVKSRIFLARRKLMEIVEE